MVEPARANKKIVLWIVETHSSIRESISKNGKKQAAPTMKLSSNDLQKVNSGFPEVFQKCYRTLVSVILREI